MRPEIKGMAPMFMVFDMPASLNFYHDILGFEIIEKAGPPDDIGWVYLKYNDIELMLNTAYELHDRPSEADANRHQHHSDTCLYFGCPKVDEMYMYLKEKNIIVNKPEITGYGWKALYVKDPDGYNICFQWPAESE